MKDSSGFIGELLNIDEKEIVQRMKSDQIFRSEFKGFELKINDNSEWSKEFVEAQNDRVLVHLIILLTVLDRELTYMCRMSVSAIPGLLRVLSDRKSNMYEQILDWVFKNKNKENHWLPLGEHRYGAISSLEEFKALKK